MIRRMTPVSSGGSIVVTLCLMLLVCLLKESHSLPTQRHAPISTVSDYGLANLFRFYNDKIQQSHTPHKISWGDKDSLPSPLQDVLLPEKRDRGQPSCPPGISERECNYELMAVWIRMLMKDNQ